ncbi:MAG: phytanoyl-CoA dioxygenase family protein [Planctomycetales bacterium]|nr:phytanoyl-CoA dioxygenase family protein [Planctomycetales bacterium]
MSEDLSIHHRLLSDLFTDQWCEQWELSDAQVRFYHEQGYLADVELLTPVQLETLREQLAPLMTSGHAGAELWHEYHSNESPDPSQVLFHALGAWRIAPGFHDLLWHAGFTQRARQLLGGPVRFWHDQLFCKPAHHGGVVAWHQDYSYWTRTQPMQHLTCWIGLDDSTIDNGCLHYIPGSHQWDLLPITGLAGDMNAIRQVLTDEQWDRFQRPVAMQLKAGQCSFHHPLMVHGSFANHTAGPRRAVVLNAMRDGACSVTDEPLLQGATVVPSGQPVSGQLFPLLCT